MRNLLVIVVLLVVAAMAGWFRVNREGDKTLIEINRSEIRADAQRAIERGREFLDSGEQQYAEDQSWPQEQVATEPQPWQYDNQWQYQYPPAQPLDPYQR